MGMVMGISDKVVVHGLRRQDRRGRRPTRCQADPRVIAAYLGEPVERRLMALLEVCGPARRLRHRPGAVRPRLHRRRRRGRRHPRRQRRRQDHDAAGAVGHDRRGRGEVRFDGNDVPAGAAPTSWRGAGIAHVPQGRGTFVDLTVEENLRVGAYIRRDREVDADIDALVRGVPPARRAPRPGGRLDERRRAADAGHRPGLHEPAPAGAARRAVARPRPARHPRGVRPGLASSSHETGTAVLRRRAERQPGARRSPPRAYVLEAGTIVVAGHRRRAARPTSPSARRTWGC